MSWKIWSNLISFLTLARVRLQGIGEISFGRGYFGSLCDSSDAKWTLTQWWTGVVNSLSFSHPWDQSEYLDWYCRLLLKLGPVILVTSNMTAECLDWHSRLLLIWPPLGPGRSVLIISLIQPPLRPVRVSWLVMWTPSNPATLETSLISMVDSL